MIRSVQYRNSNWRPVAWAVVVILGVSSFVEAVEREPVVNRWRALLQNEVDPRFSPALVYSAELKRFVLLGGTVSHSFTGERGYDVQSFDPAWFDAASLDRKNPRAWENELPAAGESWGPRTGVVNAPGFSTPYFAMKDKAGVVRPNPRHMVLHYQYALAPWNSSVYALSAGHLLRYDLKARTWEELGPEVSPAPAARSYKQSLNWRALFADPVT